MDIKPGMIEAESFRIIESEMGEASFSPEEFAVVRRMIHATGDFSFADTVRFHGEAIAAGLRSVKAGRNILVDVNMAACGVSASLLKPWGGRVVCRISEPETAALARSQGLTRAEAAVIRSSRDNIGIAVVGNAPTALLKVMELMDSCGSGFSPDLVIGVPVGFVNAAESKDILSSRDYPFITVLGRKGGTPVAVAAVNALLRLL